MFEHLLTEQANPASKGIDAFPTDQQEQVRVQLAGNMIAVLSQALCPRIDTDGMVAAYEFMYVTPAIQTLLTKMCDLVSG